MEFRLNAITVCPEPAASANTPAKNPIPIPVPTSLKPNADLFKSPCPNIFNYELQNLQSNRWYGRINYKSDEDYAGLQIQIVLDNEGVQLGVSFIVNCFCFVS